MTDLTTEATAGETPAPKKINPVRQEHFKPNYEGLHTTWYFATLPPEVTINDVKEHPEIWRMVMAGRAGLRVRVMDRITCITEKRDAAADFVVLDHGAWGIKAHPVGTWATPRSKPFFSNEIVEVRPVGDGFAVFMKRDDRRVSDIFALEFACEPGGVELPGDDHRGMTDNLPALSPVETEIAQLEGEMRAANTWAKNTTGQARYRELLQHQEQGTNAVGQPANSRRTELEARMKNSRAWAKDAAGQREYRELLICEEGKSVERDDDEGDIGLGGFFEFGDADETRAGLEEEEAGQALVAEWSGDGNGFAENLRTAQGALATILEDLPREERVALMAGVSGLGDAAEVALMRELAAPAPSGFRPATKTDVESFAASDVGKLLMREWRQSADRKLGKVQARMQRLLFDKRISDEEFSGILRLYDHLSATEAAAWLRWAAA